MPENLHSSIDSHQTAIESHIGNEKSPEALKQALQSKRDILIAQVDQGQDELQQAASTLQTAEAKEYLRKNGENLSAFLQQIAAHGREVLVSEGKIQPDSAKIDALSASILSILGEQKNKIPLFKQFEQNKNRINEIGKTIDIFSSDVSVLDASMDESQLAQLKSQIDKLPDLEAISNEIFGTDMRMREGADISALYQSLFINEYSTAKNKKKESLDLLKEIEKKMNTEKAKAEYEGVKEAMLDMMDNFNNYTRLANTDINSMPDDKKQEFFTLEQSLLQAVSVAKSSLDGISSRMAANEINAIEGFDQYKIPTEWLQKIEGYKQARILSQNLKANGLDQYVTFKKDQNGVMTAHFNETYRKFGTWDEIDRVRLQVQHQAIAARDQVIKETEQAEIKARVAQGEKGVESIKKRLGEKAKPYFDAMVLLKKNDKAGALSSLNAYITQQFTDEEKVLHESLINNAKEQISIISKSGSFYEALASLQDSDPQKCVDLLNAYLAEYEKMTPEEKRLHAEQHTIALDTLKKVGLERINLIDDLFADIRRLHYARRKMGGNPELLPNEGVESDALAKEIAALRERVVSGQCKNVYEEYEAIKKKISDLAQKQSIEPDNSMMTEVSMLFDALNSKAPATREKALTDFAKKARGLKDYGLARKYLEYALEDEYKSYAALNPPRVDRAKVMQKMLGDPAIMDWIKVNARQQLVEMQKNGNAAGITLQMIEQRLLNHKTDEIYRSELRQQMTLDGRAGNLYQRAAHGEFVAGAYIASTRTQTISRLSGGASEALILYNEYFKDKPSDWYDPRSWGAEDWDDFEDECIKFTLETVMTMGIAAGAGSVGTRVGSGVLRALARRGLSKAAIETIESGGLKALRAAINRESQGLLKSYLVKQGTSIATEGATLFVLGQIQSGIIDPEATQQTFSSLGRGMGALGESIAKAAIYRIVGAAGHRLFASDPTFAKVVAEEAFGGIAGTGVEAAGLALHGEYSQINGKWLARTLIQNAFQAGGMRLGHRMGGGGKGHEAGKTSEANGKHTQPESSVKTMNEGKRGTESTESSAGDRTVREGKAGADQQPSKVPESLRKPLEAIERGKAPLTRDMYDRLLSTEEGVARLEALLGRGDVQLSGLDIVTARTQIRQVKEILADTEALLQLDLQNHQNRHVAEFSNAIAKVASGKAIDSSNPYERTVAHLMQRDPKLFESLKTADMEHLVEAGALESILTSRNVEYTASDGTKHVFFHGREIAEGGMGKVMNIAVVKNGRIEIKALKKPHDNDNAREVFRKEVEGIDRVSSWNDPNIVKAEIIGDDFVVYET